MQLLFHCLTFYEDITWTNFLKFYLHSPTQFQHYGYMTLPPHQIAQPSFHYSQWYEIKMYTVRVDYRGISYESSWELTPQIYQLNAHTHTHTHTYIYIYITIYLPHLLVCYTPPSGRAHWGGMWQIYCYINIYVYLVGIFEESSMRMHGMKNFKKFMRISQMVQSPNRWLTDSVLPPDYNRVSQPRRPSIQNKILLTLKIQWYWTDHTGLCYNKQHLHIKHNSDL